MKHYRVIHRRIDTIELNRSTAPVGDCTSPLRISSSQREGDIRRMFKRIYD